MSDNRSGKCGTGKVRYVNAAHAGIALDRVRAKWHSKPDTRPPVRQAYACDLCNGFHLSSRYPRPTETMGDRPARHGFAYVSWGRRGGFYIGAGRVCLWRVAFGVLPIEVDDLLLASLDYADGRKAKA